MSLQQQTKSLFQLLLSFIIHNKRENNMQNEGGKYKINLKSGQNFIIHAKFLNMALTFYIYLVVWRVGCLILIGHL